MMAMARTKLRIGDICEIRTPAGLAFLQFTHEAGNMGELVRVLPGLHQTRPDDFGVLACQRELYFTFYTLRQALAAKDVEIVSHQAVPEWAKPYPLMRLSWATDENGKTVRWKIAVASTRWTIANHQLIPAVDKLTPDQEKLSVSALWPHATMVKKLAMGWTPEREEVLRLQSIAEQKEEQQATLATTASGFEDGVLAHYLYFRSKAAAEKARQTLQGRGFEVEVRKGADGTTWLTLARQQASKSTDRTEVLRDELESLAEELGGQYDGWEMAVS